MKKLIAKILLVVMFVGMGTLALPPQRTNAFFWIPGVDPNISDILKTVRDVIVQNLIRILKQKVIANIQDQIFDKIKGQNGTPLFIKNFEKFVFEDAQYYAFQKVDEYFNVDLCANIDSNIKSTLLAGVLDVLKPELGDTEACDCPQPGDNLYENNWEGYKKLLKDDCNLFGITAIALDKGLTAEADKRRINELKAQVGSGFIDEDEYGNVKTPGRFVEVLGSGATLLPLQQEVADQSSKFNINSVVGNIIGNTINKVINKWTDENLFNKD